MPEPISFRIVQNLQAALRAIAVAGGYHNDVAAIAVKLDPNNAVEAIKAPGGPRPLALLQVDPERWRYDQANQVKLVMPVKVHWIQESDATDDNSRMQVFFRGCADVEQAITQDLSRGGLAVDTRVVKNTFMNDDDTDSSQVWAAIELEVQFHRVFGLPNG
jgi:hypothetical protein